MRSSSGCFTKSCHSDELREHHHPGHAKTRHRADGPGDEFLREDTAGMVHDHGVDGTEEEAPDDELKRGAEEHVEEDDAPFAEL